MTDTWRRVVSFDQGKLATFLPTIDWYFIESGDFGSPRRQVFSLKIVDHAKTVFYFLQHVILFLVIDVAHDFDRRGRGLNMKVDVGTCPHVVL